MKIFKKLSFLGLLLSLTSCGAAKCLHSDLNRDHLCDNCKEVISECKDNDNNHLCDYCDKTLSNCIDDNHDHLCDICNGKISECVDSNNDHKCDICLKFITSCIDANFDHKCDICGSITSICHDDNKDHYCDYCQKKTSECYDYNFDHLCDVCGTKLTDCVDNNSDHLCDICKKSLSNCVDNNHDHKCDICKATISKCEDTNFDHYCDICKTKMSDCIDQNENNICDICGKDLTPSQEEYLSKHKYGDSILYSNSIKNKIKNHYKDRTKSAYIIENSNVGIDAEMYGDNKLISRLYNPNNGGNYITNSIDPYLCKNSLKTYASTSSSIARNNTYDMGYYYYNAHILGQTFGNPSQGVSSYNSILHNTCAHTYDLENVQFLQNGNLSFDVKSSYDPQYVWKTNYNASDYDYLHVRLKTTKSSSFGIFMGSSVKGICGEQYVSASFARTNDFSDVYVCLSTMPNYKDTIINLRLDIGSAGEHIEISHFEVFKSSKDKLSGFSLDRNYHIYGDKLYEEDRIVCTDDSGSIDNFGTEIKVEKSKVLSAVVYDQNLKLVYKSQYGNDNAAAAFKIDGVGVFGIILPYDKQYVLKVSDDANYYYINIVSNTTKKDFSHLEDTSLSFRIYTDSLLSFDNFINEMQIERNPLNPFIYKAANNAKFVKYNSAKGSYDFLVEDKMGMNHIAQTCPNFYSFINAQFNSADDRKIYIFGDSSNCSFLESSVILDNENQMLPIQVEVCKNFQGEKEEPIFDPNDTFYSKAIVPFSLKAGSETQFSLLHLFQKWGQNNLKQLSSIKFFTEYYHLSTGLTETNCIAPEKDNYLPDFRSMSAPLWEDQPQHTSFGSNKLVKYTSNGIENDALHLDDYIDSSGPTYADITLNNISTDGKIKAAYRHVEMPQMDENRTYYKIDLDVLDTVTISDFKNNFSLFSANTRNEKYSSSGYLDVNNQYQITTHSTESDYSEVLTLGKDYPYYDLFGCTNSDNYVNLGILIRDADIVIGGNKLSPNFIVKNSFSTKKGCNQIDLSLNMDTITLHKGDKLSFNIILVPWGSQLSTDDSNIRTLRENTLKYPFKTTATKGTIIEDDYVPKIRVDKSTQTAIFNISDGANFVTPRIYGFNKISKPKVEQYVGGIWKQIPLNSYELENDFDGYCVYLDEDKTFSYSFAFNTGENIGKLKKIRVSLA